MALKPEDPSGGFHHSKVIAFINEKMAGHLRGPEFYLENVSQSWEEVEEKLNAILDDSEVPSQAREACVWSGLALGVRFARRQGQLQARRVQWLHDFARLHKSAAQALASNLRELTAQKEMERREAAFELRLAQANLTRVQKERDLELGHQRQQEQATAHQEQASGQQEQTTAGGAGRKGAGEAEEEALAVGGNASATRGGRGEEERNAQAEVAQELDGSILQLLGVMEHKNYTSRAQRERNVRSVETTMYSLSGTREPQATAPPELLPVQLPASFTYSYSCPLSNFSAGLNSFPQAVPVTVPHQPQMPSYWRAYDTSLWSDVGIQAIDPQELQRDRRETEVHQQRRPPVYRRPGDWDCPWCKAVNFSQREICFCCGRGIWLQS
uniref:RanBP2-type domain-containing protein n=1 Tax=Otolemur garnettii TaxID=30611 RepID=H0XVG0_OTOGA